MNDINYKFEDAKSILNIEEVYERYTMYEVKRHKAICYFHNDRTPSMSFKNEKIFNCFVCGEKGGVIELVCKIFNIKPFEALTKLNEDFNLHLDLKPKKQSKMSRMRNLTRKAIEEDKIQTTTNYFLNEINKINFYEERINIIQNELDKFKEPNDYFYKLMKILSGYLSKIYSIKLLLNYKFKDLKDKDTIKLVNNKLDETCKPRRRFYY